MNWEIYKLHRIKSEAHHHLKMGNWQFQNQNRHIWRKSVRNNIIRNGQMYVQKAYTLQFFMQPSISKYSLEREYVDISDCLWNDWHIICKTCSSIKVSKGAKIRNRYNQVPHLTQDTNGKVTNSQFGNTSESQEVIPFSAGDLKAHINRRAQMHSKHKTEKTKVVPLWNSQ